MKIEILYKKLANPAQRALQALHLAKVEDLSKYSKDEIRNLHGIGPNALKTIEAELLSVKKKFKVQKAAGRGTEKNKSTKNTAQRQETESIDRYINGFPDDIKVKLIKMRSIIKETAPDATEKISYRMPTFYLHGNLVHFAAFKNHIGFYPTPSGISAFPGEITKYRYARGSVQFPLNQDLPVGLIKRIVKFRVDENVRNNVKKL